MNTHEQEETKRHGESENLTLANQVSPFPTQSVKIHTNYCLNCNNHYLA
ncbi:hypothetical protein KMB85_gp36 [Escherichia phage vB_EcoS_W011D]|uniref:Uncharacterized protein n=1 Tax=Escherichia phage vB_EcoS_W011D TaxID=2575323 RepID=A0A4Y5NT55_9CAUD|nr:hypothetical protein KMB85_gp36 [Escherichia phage vB_EcoS_W011D]QCW18483.1 hypothetical protein vBEcoSW011D_36 [Escherichia phage vB_EcoS_W011D]